MTNFDQRGQHVARDQYNAGRDINVTIPRSQSTAPRQRDRKKLLERVQAFWITGVLERSLHGEALITLGLRDEVDVLANPWQLVVQEVDQLPHIVTPQASITQVYDEEGGDLLILGEPGSGKTTLLLELTRDLLVRANKDRTHPIPVIFNLSSWPVKQKPLVEHNSLVQWLAKELENKYFVPHERGRLWVQDDHILPLLDGLDEVDELHREACVQAINVYRQEHGSTSLAVCCRHSDYLALSSYLLLRRSVVVQPLSLEQIDKYLVSAGEKLEALQVALHEDLVLQELAKTPLMLSILTLAYEGKTVGELSGDLDHRREQVFAAYVKRMFERRGVNPHYSAQKTIRYLSYIALFMPPGEMVTPGEIFNSNSLLRQRTGNNYGMLFIIGLPITVLINLYLTIRTKNLHHMLNIYPYWFHYPDFPLNPWEFFDYATERILLRKVGSHYIFIHPLFQVYFGILYKTPWVVRVLGLLFAPLLILGAIIVFPIHCFSLLLLYPIIKGLSFIPFIKLQPRSWADVYKQYTSSFLLALEQATSEQRSLLRSFFVKKGTDGRP